MAALMAGTSKILAHDARAFDQLDRSARTCILVILYVAAL
jgi:hypothetical protein